MLSQASQQWRNLSSPGGILWTVSAAQWWQYFIGGLHL